MDDDNPLDDGTLDDAWHHVAESRTELRGARILVVDDDEALRERVTMRLTAEGYDVVDAVSASDLRRVLEAISTDRRPLDGVDLIVLDNRMTGMTGVEAIRQLMAARWETPAILITAFPEPPVKREAAMLGVLVLTKPFSLDLLTNSIVMNLLSKPDATASHSFRVSS
jgi:two-component system, response regulator, stage 0 sporulation protein F